MPSFVFPLILSSAFWEGFLFVTLFTCPFPLHAYIYLFAIFCQSAVFRKHRCFTWGRSRIIMVKLIMWASSVSLCWLWAAWFEKPNTKQEDFKNAARKGEATGQQLLVVSLSSIKEQLSESSNTKIFNWFYSSLKKKIQCMLMLENN